LEEHQDKFLVSKNYRTGSLRLDNLVDANLKELDLLQLG
jgi:hypothetical protein